MAKKRTSYSPHFRAKVTLEATPERHIITELACTLSVHPSLIGQWKKLLLEHLPEVSERLGWRSLWKVSPWAI